MSTKTKKKPSVLRAMVPSKESTGYLHLTTFNARNKEIPVRVKATAIDLYEPFARVNSPALESIPFQEGTFLVFANGVGRVVKESPATIDAMLETYRQSTIPPYRPSK